jgi:hypothetical protein
MDFALVSLLWLTGIPIKKQQQALLRLRYGVYRKPGLL